MATISEARALPYFTDTFGQPLESGFIYIGQAGLDPVAYPATVTSDASGTTVVTQPIRTTHGHAAAAGALIHLFCPIPYSITVLDAAGRTCYASLNETDPIAIAVGTSSVQSAASLNELRARSKGATNQVWVNNYGMYTYVPTDTTSPESVPTIIVASDGGRYYLNTFYTTTAPTDDNSNLVATTGWTQTNMPARVNTICRYGSLGAAKTLARVDCGYQYNLSGTAFVVTLPTPVTAGAGCCVAFVNTTGNSYSIVTPTGSIFSRLGNLGTTIVTAKTYQFLMLRTDGANWFVSESLGYEPVQQGTGMNQSSSDVKIGWDNINSLLCSINANAINMAILTSVSAYNANAIGCIAVTNGVANPPNGPVGSVWTVCPGYTSGGVNASQAQSGSGGFNISIWVRTT